jgi:hypothetical protein
MVQRWGEIGRVVAGLGQDGAHHACEDHLIPYPGIDGDEDHLPGGGLGTDAHLGIDGEVGVGRPSGRS